MTIPRASSINDILRLMKTNGYILYIYILQIIVKDGIDLFTLVSTKQEYGEVILVIITNDSIHLKVVFVVYHNYYYERVECFENSDYIHDFYFYKKRIKNTINYKIVALQ